MTDYPIILDIWQENAQFDEINALEAGVLGIVLRINRLNGKTSMDTNFLAQWDQSKVFPARMAYFVFNPWQKGKNNWAWLKDNLPADSVKKFALDVEVKYDGITKKEYANQVFDFIRLARLDGYEPIIYTGAWFLSYLNRWPADVDYWWARYPDAAKPTLNTWDELVQKMHALEWQPDFINKKNYSPGPVKLWQTAESWSPPGCYGHAIDVNIFNGSEQECLEWMGVKAVTAPVSEPSFDHWYDDPKYKVYIDQLVEMHNL